MTHAFPNPYYYKMIMWTPYVPDAPLPARAMRTYTVKLPAAGPSSPPACTFFSPNRLVTHLPRQRTLEIYLSGLPCPVPRAQTSRSRTTSTAHFYSHPATLPIRLLVIVEYINLR